MYCEKQILRCVNRCEKCTVLCRIGCKYSLHSTNQAFSICNNFFHINFPVRQFPSCWNKLFFFVVAQIIWVCCYSEVLRSGAAPGLCFEAEQHPGAQHGKCTPHSSLTIQFHIYTSLPLSASLYYLFCTRCKHT